MFCCNAVRKQQFHIRDVIRPGALLRQGRAFLFVQTVDRFHTSVLGVRYFVIVSTKFPDVRLCDVSSLPVTAMGSRGSFLRGKAAGA
jgi:hypothetical protein